MSLRPSKALAVAAAAATFLAMAAAGCTDPTVAPKSTVSGANIFNDPNAYVQYIAKIYGGLILTGQQGPAGNADISGIDEGFSSYLRLHWYMQEVPTDEAVIGWGDPGLPDMNIDQWTASNGMVQAMYYRVFFQVSLVNEFLRQTSLAALNSRGVSTPLKVQIQNYRAEARFLRALSYWHGLDFYGNVPLITENDAAGSLPRQVGRDSVYKFVVSELKAIHDSLPARGAASYGRATPAAADMLLAELYLNAGVYTGTPDYANAVLSAAAVIGAGYTINPVFQNNFTADNNISNELIFVAAQDGNHSQTWGGMTFLVHAECGGNMSASTYGMDYCWGGYRMKQQAYHNFVAGDARGAFFWTSGQDSNVTSIGDFSKGVAAPKFTNKTSTGGNGSQQTMVDTDFPIFRLAEAYLIYAEANIRGGGGSAGNALTYLNLLRERAFGGTSHDFAALPPVDTILAERGRELLFEGKRRTDLIRFGKFSGGTYLWAWKGNVAGGASIPSTMDIFPLPTNELVANPGLVQNPGY